MANLRNVMLVAVVAATAFGASAGFFFLGGPPSRILVDAGVAVAVAVIVWFMLAPTVGRVDAMVESLRALARGDKHQRLDPDQFAGFAEIARAVNEVAASLTVDEDPNLGPVKSVPRPRPESAPRDPRPMDPRPMDPQPKPMDAQPKPMDPQPKPAEVRPHPASDDSHHPEIGPVRVLKKPPERTKGHSKGQGAKSKNASKTPAKTVPPEPAAEEAKGEPTRPPQAVKMTEERELSSPHIVIPPEKPRTDLTNSTDIDGEPEVRQTPSRAELEGLFQEFVARKKSQDENIADLDIDAFAQTIQGECERLIAAHQCKGVRFEITMQDGEVSLRPRLLR